MDAIILLEFRQEELLTMNRKLDEIHCQIELIDVDNMEAIENDREAFENEYFSIGLEMQEIINAEESHNSSINNNSMSTVVV